MKNKLFKYICIIAFLSTYLTSCKSITHSQSIGHCIDPSFKLAFPTYATAQPNSSPVTEVLPGGDWRIETAVPNGDVSSISSFVIRGKNELWLTISQNVNVAVYRYRIDTHEWTRFISTSNEPVVPQGLIVSSDGTLWGVGWVDYKLGQTHNNSYPILSQFDDVAEQFQFIEGNNEKLQSFSAPRNPPMIQIDNSGVLWLILDRGINSSAGLYSFDPVNKKLTHHLSDLSLSGLGSIAIAPNNEIWLFDPALKPKLIHYFPQTGKYDDSFINRSDWNVESWWGGLYFDRSGRLWIGDNGWIDFTNGDMPVWYQIIRSPAFITDYYDGENQHVWLHPSNIFQSSNGWYWFSLPDIGIVRLDIKAEEWCRFTTEYSPVIEDSQQRIWIIVTNKLYMYKITE